MHSISRIAFGSALVLGVVLAGAVGASAAEPTKILPEPTEAKPLAVAGTASKLLFETVGGTKFACKEAAGEGKFTTPNAGQGEVRAMGCESTGFKCNSPGAKSGEIILKDEGLYWLGLSAAKTLITVAAALITHTLEFECTALVKVKKRGCAAEAIPAGELNKFQKVFTGSIKQSKGKQEITEILPPEAKSFIKCVSEVSINGGAFELIGQEGEGTLTFAKEVELMN